MNRLIGAMFGEDTLASFGYTLSGFGNMVLGRYDRCWPPPLAGWSRTTVTRTCT